ncbi:MAG: hypothetical protein VXW09_00380 [Pseudomonadota bacterium]|nr:hypothetical protein [Pseudomonadota bacterium]
MNEFTFINHASYTIETEKSILVVDPWVEGYAFDKGWALLDKTTSNERLINLINNKKKDIYIWLSHEHSDHFSIPFLMLLKSKNVKAKFLFQKTLDGRVSAFIKKIGFDVIESNYKKISIDNELSLVIFPFAGGDSYCLTLLKEHSILNLNDCVINNKKVLNNVITNVNKYTSKLDLLLTQFGYANWIGNVNEAGLRISEANEKLSQIKLQIDGLKPKNLIPFASFIYFCDNEKFYINDSQNTPKNVEKLFSDNNFTCNLIILKPMDNINLSNELSTQSKLLNKSNIKYWEDLVKNVTPDKIDKSSFVQIDIINEYKNYCKKIFRAFLFSPNLLERLNFLVPINIYINDLNITVSMSYTRNLIINNGKTNAADLSLSSSTMIFILKNEYGSNTAHINGKFSRLKPDGIKKFVRHFSPQEYMKMGYGLNHPFITIKNVIGKLIYKFIHKNWTINPSKEN